MMDKIQQHFSVIVIALAIIIATGVLASAIKNRNKSNNTISVVGLGQKSFEADLVVWEGDFVRKSDVLQDAYSQLNRDRETTKNYLVSKGIPVAKMVFSAVNIERQYNYTYGQDGSRSETFGGFKLSQTVKIESNEIDKIESVSREVTELINQGVEFNSRAPQYFYTKLGDLKKDLIAEATSDAKDRAETIAKNSGGGLGDLKNATMGVFQITEPNSTEDYNWGGAFNTASRKKQATITVRLQYEAR